MYEQREWKIEKSPKNMIRSLSDVTHRSQNIFNDRLAMRIARNYQRWLKFKTEPHFSWNRKENEKKSCRRISMSRSEIRNLTCRVGMETLGSASATGIAWKIKFMNLSVVSAWLLILVEDKAHICSKKADDIKKAFFRRSKNVLMMKRFL